MKKNCYKKCSLKNNKINNKNTNKTALLSVEPQAKTLQFHYKRTPNRYFP